MINAIPLTKGNDSVRHEMQQDASISQLGGDGKGNIQLAWNTIGEEVVEAFTQQLRAEGVQTIDLLDNNLGESSAERVVGTLCRQIGLSSLLLRFNNIGKGGCDAIGQVVRSNRSLSHVDVRGNKLGRGEVEGMFSAMEDPDCSVTKLGLGGNYLGSEGAERVSGLLVGNYSITHLELWGNELGPQGAANLNAGLVSHNQLLHLDLWKNKLGSLGALRICRSLSECIRGKLRTLRLSDNNLGDEGGEMLGEQLPNLRSLEEIDIANNGIGNVGFVALGGALGKHPALRIFKFAGNVAAADGGEGFFRGLMSNRTVTHLDLSNVLLGERGADRMATVIQEHPALCNLTLCSCRIDDAGALKLAAVVEGALGLKSLDLLDNQISEVGGERLVTAISFNKHISFVNLVGNNLTPSVQKRLDNTMTQRTAQHRWKNTTPSSVSSKQSGLDGVASDYLARVKEGKNILESGPTRRKDWEALSKFQK